MLLIGTKIQEYRKNRGLSQEEFAAGVGVTRQAVSKWETDKAYPDLDKLVTICDILQIGIMELISEGDGSKSDDSKSEEPKPEGTSSTTVAAELPSLEKSAGQASEMKEIAVLKARGKGAYLRLWVMVALIGGMFLFCGALLVTTLTRHSWKKEDDPAQRVRVERVYQQYTKADVSLSWNNARRVVKTVWLDVNGIREGDFLFCYTDGDQKEIYYEYHASTLVGLAAVELVFLVLLLICLAECRRLARENRWHIRVVEAKEKGAS